MYRRIPALAVAALVFALFACTANSPSPPPASLPPLPYTCPPTPGSQFTTPYPCTSAEHSVNNERLERDALEAEAIALYQRFAKEVTRLEWSGGTTAMTPELDATTEYPLKGEVLEYLSDQKNAGEVLKGPEPRLSWKVLKDERREGSLVTLRTCEDMRGAILHGSDGAELGRGRVVVGKRYFKRFDGVLKIFFTSLERTDACPF